MIETWSLIWKYTFFIGIGLFALMSLWVIIAGAIDISTMLKTLQSSHDDECE